MEFIENKIYVGENNWWEISSGLKFETLILPETIFLGELDPEEKMPGEGKYFSHRYFLEGHRQSWIRNYFSEKILQNIIKILNKKIKLTNNEKRSKINID